MSKIKCEKPLVEQIFCDSRGFLRFHICSHLHRIERMTKMGNSLSNENPALAEIKKQWSDVDDQHLIVPSLFVQDNNPFYRLTGVAVKVDIHERGAVFPLQSEKTGTDQYGKDVWEKTYYLSKMTIDRFAAAAGVSFVPANSGTMVDVNGNITGFAQIMLLAPDGGPRYVNNVKNIDLQVVRENLYKNKKKNLLKWGLSGDEGKLAAKQYEGEWKKDKYKESYFIDQSDVEAFLQAHVNQAMVQESKSVHEKAYTGAYLRAVRTALGINASYTESQLKKRLSSPDLRSNQTSTTRRCAKWLCGKAFMPGGGCLAATISGRP